MVVLCGGGMLYLTSCSSLPIYSGTISAGTLNDISILRDKRGVAYIKASTMEDLYFAQGYIHAQERLWQMDFNRRIVRGQLSETLGSDFLKKDRFLRALGLHRIAKRVVEKPLPKGELHCKVMSGESTLFWRKLKNHRKCFCWELSPSLGVRTTR